MATKRVQTPQQKQQKARRGNVLFIDATPELKELLAKRAMRNHRSMTAEAVAILEEKLGQRTA